MPLRAGFCRAGRSGWSLPVSPRAAPTPHCANSVSQGFLAGSMPFCGCPDRPLVGRALYDCSEIYDIVTRLLHAHSTERLAECPDLQVRSEGTLDTCPDRCCLEQWFCTLEVTLGSHRRATSHQSSLAPSGVSSVQAAKGGQRIACGRSRRAFGARFPTSSIWD